MNIRRILMTIGLSFLTFAIFSQEERQLGYYVDPDAPLEVKTVLSSKPSVVFQKKDKIIFTLRFESAILDPEKGQYCQVIYSLSVPGNFDVKLGKSLREKDPISPKEDKSFGLYDSLDGNDEGFWFDDLCTILSIKDKNGVEYGIMFNIPAEVAGKYTVEVLNTHTLLIRRKCVPSNKLKILGFKEAIADTFNIILHSSYPEYGCTETVNCFFPPFPASK